jgi:hypothetical protein
VNVFQKVLLTEENDHLKTFCMLVPSLCISWVEASLVSKENMAKVVKGAPTREIYFTDDGFAMGIAYCLAILKQTKKNEALHWEETVVAKHKADKQVLEEQLAERSAREAKLMEKKKKRSSWFRYGRFCLCVRLCSGYVYYIAIVTLCVVPLPLSRPPLRRRKRLRMLMTSTKRSTRCS